MENVKLLHAGLLVSDVARAREFYEGVLGFLPKARPDLGYDGAWYDLGACELHLMGTSAALLPAQSRPPRDFHVAIAVADLAALRARLDSRGIAYRLGRHAFPQLFVRDPDGNQVELQGIGPIP
ncbi:MAG: VOC family protein [Pseudomonadota bacterium]